MSFENFGVNEAPPAEDVIGEEDDELLKKIKNLPFPLGGVKAPTAENTAEENNETSEMEEYKQLRGMFSLKGALIGSEGAKKFDELSDDEKAKARERLKELEQKFGRQI